MIMQPVFKCHSVHQQELFPLNLNDLISENHSARLIDSVVERLEIPDIISQYKGGGTSSYHPKMLLKILFYGYLNNTYSCRKKDKERLQGKIDAVLAEIGQAIDSDVIHTDNQNDIKIDSQKLQEKIGKINIRLKKET